MQKPDAGNGSQMAIWLKRLSVLPFATKNPNIGWIAPII